MRRFASRINKKAPGRKTWGFFAEDGALGGIRTHDPCLRRAVLYPAELRVQCGRHHTYVDSGRPRRFPSAGACPSQPPETRAVVAVFPAEASSYLRATCSQNRAITGHREVQEMNCSMPGGLQAGLPDQLFEASWRAVLPGLQRRARQLARGNACLLYTSPSPRD